MSFLRAEPELQRVRSAISPHAACRQAKFPPRAANPSSAAPGGTGMPGDQFHHQPAAGGVAEERTPASFSLDSGFITAPHESICTPPETVIT